MPRFLKEAVRDPRFPKVQGQLKLRLPREPLDLLWEKKDKSADEFKKVNKFLYRTAKRSEVFGFTRGYGGKAVDVWAVGVRKYLYGLKGEKIKRHVDRHHLGIMFYTRVEAGAEEHGLSLWDLRKGLAQSDVGLNNKMLSELAVYEPKTFESLCELARKKLEDSERGLEGILRPDLEEQGIVHRTGLVPNHGYLGTCSTHEKHVEQLRPPRAWEIPPPEGWRVTGHYPGKNLVRAMRYHRTQRPKLPDYQYTPFQAEGSMDAYPPNKMGKVFRFVYRRKPTDPEVYRKRQWLPIK